MNVTITAHHPAASGDADQHSFTFRVRQGRRSVTQTVSVRTARVLAQELADRTALDAMMRAIAAAPAADYDTLVGTRYADT